MRRRRWSPRKRWLRDLARLKYTYWFDERLLPIEVFGQVINQQIDEAKAVITIWSEPDSKSKWVYAEALRADDQNKLLNLHMPEVKPGSIPVPFNAGHVSPIGDRTAIYAALARLGVHPGGAAPMELGCAGLRAYREFDGYRGFRGVPGRFRRRREAVLYPAGAEEDRGTVGCAGPNRGCCRDIGRYRVPGEAGGGAAAASGRCVLAYRAGDAHSADQAHRRGCGRR